ncbi:hypothetical protein OC845_005871 [Tilletia horrida]|nr:hypothetical protein OC845_005871 [Tilletia horrida]
MLSTAKKPRSSIPISEREGPVKYVQLVTFVAVFLFAMLCEHGTQILLWPLFYFDSTRPIYDRGVAYTKKAFAHNLCLISQLFAPTKLVISFSDESGKLLDPETFVTRAPSSYNGASIVKGKVTGVSLPQRAVVFSNHQIYLDWLYIWVLALYANLGDAIHIVLKDSLKWTPIIGPAMQFFHFIFMKRKWDDDKKNLSDQLAYLADRAKPFSSRTSMASSIDANRASGAPSSLLLSIFPEGTLVSDQSRPLSKKYADKVGETDFRNMVYPRSTGLFFCLRTLAADIPDLKIIDMACGYTGIPPQGVGQQFYTLRSVYMDGVAPQSVHMHIIISRVSSFHTSGSDSPPLGKLPRSARDSPSQLPTEGEKREFDSWLLKRWRRKDELLDRFYRDGDFVGGAYAHSEAAGEYRRPAVQLESAPNGKAPAKVDKKEAAVDIEGSNKWVELPIEMQSPLAIGDVFCWFAPVFAIYFLVKLIRGITG